MEALCLVCSKTIWNKTNPLMQHLIDIAARCLLIDGNQLILIDTGMATSNLKKNFDITLGVPFFRQIASQVWF
jgi:hypothetical protein